VQTSQSKTSKEANVYGFWGSARLRVVWAFK